jgi:uncharacterized membrane protein YjgN (DUF898 family)
MDNQKLLQFNGTAGGYFVVFIVTAIAAYIPIIGWAFGFNYGAEWAAENTLINGRRVVYKAGFGETLKFLFINLLLLIVTLGIYTFWFLPKSYRYMADHTSYADGPAAGIPAAPTPLTNPLPAQAVPLAPAPAPTPTPGLTPSSPSPTPSTIYPTQPPSNLVQ